MPKAILEFELPAEREELQSAVDGGKWKSLLFSITRSLRSGIKHNSDDKQRATVEDLLTYINNEIESHNLSLEED